MGNAREGEEIMTTGKRDGTCLNERREREVGGATCGEFTNR